MGALLEIKGLFVGSLPLDACCVSTGGWRQPFLSIGSSSADPGSITAAAEQHILFVGANAGQVVKQIVLQLSLTWHCLCFRLTSLVARARPCLMVQWGSPIAYLVLLAPTLGQADHLHSVYIYLRRIGQPHDCCNADNFTIQGDIASMVYHIYELHKCCINTWIVDIRLRHAWATMNRVHDVHHIQEQLGRNHVSSTS